MPDLRYNSGRRAIKPCKCDCPVHSICLVEVVKNKKELGLEAKCDVCLESFNYTNKRSCTRCCNQMCSDMCKCCIVNHVLGAKYCL